MPEIILVSRLVTFYQHLLLPTTFPRIFELQAKLYTKQREFIKGIRNKMPHAELKELNEELKKIRQEILALKSNEL